MLWVSSTQEFPDVGVSVFPEIVEVLGHLCGLSVWGQQVEDDGDFSVSDAWDAMGAEGFLDFDADDGDGGVVIDACGESGFEGDAFRGFFLERVVGFVGEGLDGVGCEIDLVEVVQGLCVRDGVGDDVEPPLGVERRELELWVEFLDKGESCLEL